MIPSEVFISTETIDPIFRNDFWRDVTLPLCDTTPVDSATKSPMGGTIQSRVIGKLLIARITYNAQRYRRDQRIITRSGLDSYMIALLTMGSVRGLYGRHDVAATAGDIYITDLTRSLESQVDQGSRLTMIVPRKDLERALGRRDLHGVVLKGGRPTTQLLIDYLWGLKAVSTYLSAEQGIAAQEAMTSLLAACLTAGNIVESAMTSTLSDILRERVLEFIDANLACRKLSLDLLMCRFRVSRAHLYRIFTEDGGVSTLIRNKRLDAAYQTLRARHESKHLIASIATEYGFSSETQFLHAFRSRFGITPDEIQHADATQSTTLSGPHSLHHHFTTYRSMPSTELSMPS